MSTGFNIYCDESCHLENDHQRVMVLGAVWTPLTATARLADAASGERLLDSPRAKRLAWARATIDHAESDDVVVFDYEEGSGRVRTYLWVNDQDYVVILERQNRGHRQGYFLVTAFSLDGPSRRRAMEKKYQNRRP